MPHSRLLRSFVRWIGVPLLTALASALPNGAAAQGSSSPDPASAPIMSRDPDGRVTVRATRVAVAPRIDGVLDEELYRHLDPITDFIQQDPHEGQLATEPTLVW